MLFPYDFTGDICYYCHFSSIFHPKVTIACAYIISQDTFNKTVIKCKMFLQCQLNGPLTRLANHL